MLDSNYWNERYQNSQTGWDIGHPSPPITEYIDTLENKDMRVLIPGAGNAYEAEYLFKKGFTHVTVLDIAEEAIQSFQKRVPNFPKDQIINQDFFKHNDQYDLILEQTFFCALDPSLRTVYAQKMYDSLNSKGILAGLLFDAELNKDRPPFGGNKDEYLTYFKPYFRIHQFDTASNSIQPRLGRELFIKLEKIDLNI